MTGSFPVADHLRCLASASSDILTDIPFLVTAFWDRTPCCRLDSPLTIPMIRIGASCPQPSPIVERQGKTRVKADGLVIVGNRLDEVFLVGPGVASVVERQGILRVKSNSLAVIFDRLVVFP